MQDGKFNLQKELEIANMVIAAQKILIDTQKTALQNARERAKMYQVYLGVSVYNVMGTIPDKNPALYIVR
jgi:hypothetical protein